MTSTADLPDTTTSVAVNPAERQRSVFRRLMSNPQGAICVVFVALVVLVAIAAPWISPYGPRQTDIGATNAGPFTPGHILGGDSAGQDILSRLIWGTRQSLIAVVIVTVVSLVLGVTSGLIAGFYRGWFETVVDFISDVILSLPGIVLLIALFAVTGPNTVAAMAVFGVIVAPTFFRLVRSVVVSVRNELYVDAARVVGLADWRIIGRHVLWAVRAPIIIQSAFTAASGIGIEAGVSFLGLGDPAGTSWGIVLQRSFNSIYNNPWGVVWPSLVVSITILALILLGNALSDVLQSSARSKVLPKRQQRSVLAEQRSRIAVLPQRDSAPIDDEVVLAVRDLRVAYPQPDGSVREVVHGVDINVRRGEIHGLVGESGSGKSQIAFSVLGILPREALVLSGNVLIGGKDVLVDRSALAEARGRRVGYVPQEPMSNLDPSFTVGSQLVRGLRVASSLTKSEARARVLQLLADVGITDPERVMKLYPHQISGGMAQRVLICGAIASDPDVIVADEPTTALDVTVQAEVLEILRRLSKERGLGMILVTHNLGVVADLCDTVSVMKEGIIVERAGVDDLFGAPRQMYTQKLLASARSVELTEERS